MSEVKLRKLLQPWHYDWPTFSASCPLLFRLLKPELSSTKKSGFVFWPLSDDAITNLAISIFSFVGNTTHLTTVLFSCQFRKALWGHAVVAGRQVFNQCKRFFSVFGQLLFSGKSTFFPSWNYQLKRYNQTVQ